MANIADTEKAVGRKLRTLRRAAGLSQDEVGQRMKAYGYDLHQTMVSKIEQAKRPLCLNETVALAAIFGVTLAELVESDCMDTANTLRQMERGIRKRIAAEITSDEKDSP